MRPRTYERNFDNNLIKPKPDILLIYNLYIFAGRRHGRQLDDYVDDLFENVLDQGPPVSDTRSH